MADFLITKCSRNPVLGPGLGTCFDISVLDEQNRYRMWFSWRDRKAIGHVTSADGVTWSTPPNVVIAAPKSRWWHRWKPPAMSNVSRPAVIHHDGKYHLWYSEHSTTVCISYAVSADGLVWTDHRHAVLKPEHAWEKTAVMCPCVIFDDEEQVYKMWYSAGEQYEPDAIGYATSMDGFNWTKRSTAPVFIADASCPWEKDRVTAMHVLKHDGSYYGFYVGFADGFEKSCVGAARSADGVTWVRHPQNPLLTPGAAGSWDDCNIYKPYVIETSGELKIWYNASRRSDRVEQIGLATCDKLFFDSHAA
jgi:beta-xylosidase